MLIKSTKNISHSSIKMLIYGLSGVGKTTLAKTIGEPTLIISAESGLLSLADAEVDVIEITTDDNGNVLSPSDKIARLAQVYKYLLNPETQKKYKWVFIDSLSEIFQNLIEHLYTQFPERKDALPMWGEFSKKTRSIIKSFRDLPNYNVVFTALSIREKSEEGRFVTTLDLNGKIQHQITAFFDEVFYMTIATDADGNDKRLLLTQNTENTVAKDRSGKLNKFEEPNLGLIARKIKGI